MQITSITVENFRSFGKAQTIPLGKLTLLVGANNAGKTNALEILSAVKMFISSPQNAALNLAHFLRAEASGFAIDIHFKSESKPGRYSIRVGPQERLEDLSFSDRSYSCRNGQVSSAWHSGGVGSNSALTHMQSFRPTSDIVSYFLAYEIRRALPQYLADPSPVQRVSTVGPNGQNAAAVLDHLRDRFPDRYTAIQEDLRRCAPEFDRVVAEASEQAGQKEIWFYEKSGASFRCRQVSEGLKFLLFVLLILHSPDPPRIFALEEVEHGLHPRRLRDVISFLRQLTNRPDGPQIILTSHSPYVLDQFRDTPQDVVIVERDETRSTICTSLAERLKTVHDKDAPLGEIWFQGLVGGVPPT